MIVAGLGCRAGVDMAAVLAAVDDALARARQPRDALHSLAIPHFKASEAALHDAARALALPLRPIDQDALEQACARATTHSDRVRRHAGVSSVAEAAALAAAGPDSRLLAARNPHGAVTCAIAIGASAP